MQALAKETGSLAARQETFLARYSRNSKLAVVTILFAVIMMPRIFGGLFGHSETVGKTPDKTKLSVQSADSNKPVSLSDNSSGDYVANAGPSSFINAQDDHTIKMALAPDEGLSEDTPEGTLPRIGSDGRQPWQVYARPFNTADTRPRIAIVITDLGLSRSNSDQAIARLPANVTLAFDTQSPVVGAWCNRARQDGHETLLMIPMEPFDYPRSDPGPNTLLTGLPNTDNIIRLNNSLHAATGYVGITTISGSRFTTNPEKLDSILDVLKRRGLMVMDARIAPHSAVPDMAHERKIPVALATEQLDQNLTPEAIDDALTQLEKSARLTGRAIGITAPYPMMVDKLQAWLKTLPERGIALAPVSAMVK